MIIENADALKSWLTSCLGRLCDADPAALAKYVLALVKKDKAENDLKAFCVDQLEVFLLKETKNFVELLFQTLKTKAYLHGNNTNLLPPAKTNLVLNPDSSVVDNRNIVQSSSFNIVPAPSKPIIKEVPSTIDTYPSTSIVIKTENDLYQNPPLEAKDRETIRYPPRSRSPSRSRSGSPADKVPRLRSRSRESDNRLRKRPDDEKHRHKNFFPRREGNRHYKFRTGDHIDHERDRNVRDKDRRIPCAGGHDRQRSRSKSRSRSLSRDRHRSRSLSSNSSGYSRSSRARSRESRELSGRSDSRNTRKRDDNDPEGDHGDKDYRIAPPLNMNLPSRSNDDLKTKIIERRTRCEDYNGRGYCMRGDQCPFDHGVDPLVVDDVSALSFNAPGSQVPPKSNSVVPNIVLPQPPGVESPVPPLPSASPPPLPPPPPPLPPPPGSYHEPYNPETPALFHLKGERIPYWTPSSPPPPLHPVGQPPILPSLIGNIPPFNPSEPPPPLPFHPPPKMQRTRELIGVPTLGPSPTNTSTAIENGTVSEYHSLPSLRRRAETNTAHITNAVSSVGVSNVENTFKKKSFDYSRLGTRKPPKKNNDRTVLELRKVPKNLNTVTNLSNHFSQFGCITNILTNIDNDPEAALVSFSTHAEALAAYRHKEAVMHNRFIKLFWHNKDTSNNAQPLENSSVSTTKLEQRLANSKNDSHTSKDSGTDVTSTTPITVSESRFTNMESGSDRSSLTNLSKPMFNPAALRKNNVTIASKKIKEGERRMENLKKKLDLHKKKQSILDSLVVNQKMLLEKLTICKVETDKESLKNTMDSVRRKILELETDLKKDTEEIKKLCGNNKFEKKIAEKELLDAELDLYNKQHKGDDVSDLISKVRELKRTMFTTSRGRATKLRRGSTKFLSTARTLQTSSRSIDRRPRKLMVSNAAGIDKIKLQSHFMQFGNIENIEITNEGAIVTFKTRKEAELALTCGSSFGELILAMNFYPDNSSAEQPKQADFNLSGESSCALPLEEEEEEEEEEEDSEARSWRR